MKTYNQFITELNKVEALMKAGKLAAKTIRRISPDAPNLLGGVKVTGELKKVKVPFRNIIRHRDSPMSNISSPRRKIENFMKVADVKNPSTKPYKGTIFDTAKRQKDFRGKGKKQSAEMDKIYNMMPQQPKVNQRTVGLKGLGDSNRQLNVPANYKASKEMNVRTYQQRILDEPATPVYNKNTRGQLTTKSVKYDKVPDSIENKIRDAIRQRKKKQVYKTQLNN